MAVKSRPAIQETCVTDLSGTNLHLPEGRQADSLTLILFLTGLTHTECDTTFG